MKTLLDGKALALAYIIFIAQVFEVGHFKKPETNTLH